MEGVMGKDGFRSLQVWQRGKELAIQVYKITEKGGLSRDFGLKDQMRRAAVSICSNIAEGDERGSDKDSVRFFYMAKGSLAELSTQVEIAAEIGYFSSGDQSTLEMKCTEIGKMLGSLIKSRQSRIEQLDDGHRRTAKAAPCP
jgi:four helix bundle protein